MSVFGLVNYRNLEAAQTFKFSNYFIKPSANQRIT